MRIGIDCDGVLRDLITCITDTVKVTAGYFTGLDGDLDYSNEIGTQLSANKLYPSHPIGSGMLAAPFVFIFSTNFDKIRNRKIPARFQAHIRPF